MINKLIISLADQETVLDIPEGYSILSVLRKHQINIPFSCTSGRCGKCKVKHIDGQYEYKMFSELGIRLKAKNMMLSCITTTTSDLVIEIPKA